MEGIQRIAIVDEGLVVIHNAAVVTAEAIDTAFALQGFTIRP